MRRNAVAVALIASLLAAAPASADDDKKPSRARAAEQFDAGVGAFKKKDFEGAATHFEAANAAAPSATALRQAIRARVEAGQGARAATLSVLAIARYASDGNLNKLARDTIEKFEPILHKVHVHCASPCTVAQGPQSVPGEPASKWIVYLDPGAATLTTTFAAGGPPLALDVDAKAGGEGDLSFEPKKKAEPPPLPPPPTDPTPDKASKGEVPPEETKPEEPPAEKKGISPAFFIVGMAATVGLGAATIWSGVDTQNNPGAAAVKAGCVNLGTSCPLYQEGLSKQTRTNALIGATAGTAVVTVILAVFTNWHGAKKAPPAEPVAMGGDPPTPPPRPTALVVDHGAVFGAAGVF